MVLSSTWRLGYTMYGAKLPHHMEYLTKKLAKQGLEIYSVTPDWSRGGRSLRGREIRTWLDENPDPPVDEWVVLDDEYFYDFNSYNITPHWVETSYYSRDGGLTDDKVEEAIRVLNGGLPDGIQNDE